MLKEGKLIGAIGIYRQEVQPFTDKQIELVTNFAAQAVIAIENTRLLNELRETLERQTATSEVLKVISSSPGELQPVFDAMLENATRISGAKFGNLFLCEPDGYRAVAVHGEPQSVEDYRREPFVPLAGNADTPLGLLTASRDVVHIPDLRTMRGFADGNTRLVALVEVAGARTLMLVPMTKDEEIVGAIAIYRQEVRPFSDKQIELVQNFAAQAVIAIENTRLLNELRESLEQQTATSEVLKVIARSTGELQPVFEAILNNATRLCAAKFGHLYLCEGDALRSTAMHNVPEAFAEERRRHPLVRPEPGSLLRRLFDTKVAINVSDATKEQAYIEGQPRYVSAVKLGGFRSMLAVPMLKDGALIGAVLVYRQEVSTFSDKQIALVQNFAAQAVIAIENTRLLNELRQRTDDLTESLEQQTATSEVLQVISSSSGELQPVFQTMLENAVQICGAKFGMLYLSEDDSRFRTVAMHDVPSAFSDARGRNPVVSPLREAPWAASCGRGRWHTLPISGQSRVTPKVYR